MSRPSDLQDLNNLQDELQRCVTAMDLVLSEEFLSAYWRGELTALVKQGRATLALTNHRRLVRRRERLEARRAAAGGGS